MLEAIEEPPQDFKSVDDLFKRTLEHEKKVTGMINGLVNVAVKENDKQTGLFLRWFVKEQVEEEANPASILKKMSTFGNGQKELLRLDEQLAQRK
jgi:ferritin